VATKETLLRRLREKQLSRCPNDNMLIPRVADMPGAEPVEFFWCWSCRELFAFVGNPARLAAELADDGQGGWRLFRAVGTEADLRLATAAAACVPRDAARQLPQGGRSQFDRERP
jgi:hypothetical protein